jgi:ABC-type nitrate/sulfonate/bicarbonate transport system substrate-binding protein
MIRTIHFPGLTALPLYVAATKRFFDAQGVAVALTAATNSRELMTGVLTGAYEIGQAAIDNLVAYQERQATPELEVERDLIGIMATTSANLDFVVQPDVQSYPDLKGKTLAVDALTTGFAFVLRKMLERGGLTESDYRLAAVGGDAARLAALKKGEAAGGLLAKDFSKQALAFGLHKLAESLDVLERYQGTSLFVRRQWAPANRDALTAFVRAVRRAHDWIFEQDNAAEAASILTGNTPGMAADSAPALVVHLLAKRGGLSRTGAFDIEGLKLVLSLRSQYGEPKRKLDDPSRYFDPSFLALAETG